MYLIQTKLGSVVDSKNLLTIEVYQDYSATIRLYRDSNYGKRVLGKGRFALDFGRLSLVLENYNRARS